MEAVLESCHNDVKRLPKINPKILLIGTVIFMVNYLKVIFYFFGDNKDLKQLHRCLFSIFVEFRCLTCVFATHRKTNLLVK